MSGYPVDRYRCLACGMFFLGRRMFCIRCTQAGIERAAERVPCGKGHTRRPEQPCSFCLPEVEPEPTTQEV